MIKLNAIPPPVELTQFVIDELTNKYILTKESVWNKDYIKKALLEMSNNKCCYCECKIDEESKYLEVEHYKPKVQFQNLVVMWNNLLPSCKHCNGHKGEHDTVSEPIINPLHDVPNEYLILKNYRLYPRNKSDLGKNTIDILDLNDRLRLVKKRFQIGEEIQTKLFNLVDDVNSYSHTLVGTQNSRRKNRIINTIKNLLLEAQPESEYSSTAATILLSDIHYQEIKTIFKKNDLWSKELQELEIIASYSSLQ